MLHLNLSHFYQPVNDVVTDSMSMKEVMAMMVSTKHNAFIVQNDAHQPVGIITMYDVVSAIVPDEMEENPNIARAMFREGFLEELAWTIAKDPVTMWMQKKFAVVDHDENLLAVLAEFLKYDHNILPVIKDKEII
jgi:CBS domain-containing protein